MNVDVPAGALKPCSTSTVTSDVVNPVLRNDAPMSAEPMSPGSTSGLGRVIRSESSWPNALHTSPVAVIGFTRSKRPPTYGSSVKASFANVRVTRASPRSARK